jgi:hypothetical protein
MQHGGIYMRRLDAPVATVSVTFVGLLLLSSPASLFAHPFPNDSYAHYGKDGTTCGEHMHTGQNAPANGNMVLCKAQSGATQWWAEVKRSDGLQMCSLPQQTVSSPKSFTCTIPTSNPKRSYRGYLHWYVGGSSQMNSTDQWFMK